MPEVRLCPICGDRLKGRSDKKFCGEECRNTHHNALKAIKSLKFTKEDKIKLLLSKLDKDTQRVLAWEHLSKLIQQDNGKHLVWLMDKTGELIDIETDKLLSPFQ